MCRPWRGKINPWEREELCVQTLVLCVCVCASMRSQACVHACVLACACVWDVCIQCKLEEDV